MADGHKLLPASESEAVPTYADFASLPVGSNGDLAVTLDTGSLYEYNGSAWQLIGAPGTVAGVSDTNTVDLTLSSNVLSAVVKYQDSTSIDLSDDSSGLKATLLLSSSGANSGFFNASSNLRADGLQVEVPQAGVRASPLTGYSAASGTVASTDTVLQAFNKIGGQLANETLIHTTTVEPSGFEDPSNVDVAYSYADRKITLSHTSGTIAWWYRGTRYTVASPWTSKAHDNTTGGYFLTIDGDISQEAWDSVSWDFSEVQVAIVRYDSGAATNSWAMHETHGLMQWQNHKEFHETTGTYWASGLGLTAATYVVYTTTTAPTNVADNTPGVDDGSVSDEDLTTTVPVLTQGTYTTAYRNGANGDWVFDTTSVVPYFVNTNTLRYNQFTGGAWQLTNLSEDNFVNVYDFAMPVATDSDSQKYRHIWVTGQAVFTSLASAQLEFPQNLDLGSLALLSPEFVCVNRITYQFNASGQGNVGAGVSGRCKIMGVTAIRGTRANQTAVVGVAPSDHGNLSGLADDDHLQYELIAGRAGNVVTQSVDFIQDSGVVLYVVDTSGGAKTVTLLDPATVAGKLVTFLNTSTNNITFGSYAIGGVSNFTIDGNERIQIVSDGTSWKQYARKSIGYWKTGITYCKDTFIEVTEAGYEGLWRCVTQHTASAAFATDIANWDLIPATYTQNDATNASASPDVTNYTAFASSASGTSCVCTFGSRGAIEFLVDVNTDGGMVIACDYKATTINALSDPSGLFLATDAGTGIVVTKSANSAAVTIKNRTGATKTIGVLAVRSSLTATAWS